MGASTSSITKGDEEQRLSHISLVANFDGKPMEIVQDSGSVCCLLTRQLAAWIRASEISIERVSFTIESHDQGWCGENDFLTKYMGSWTWFEAIIVRDFKVPEDKGEVSSDDLENRIKQAIKERRKSPVLADTEETITVNTSVGKLTTVKNRMKATKDVWHVQRNIRALSKNTAYEVFWSKVDLGLHGDMDDIEFTDMTGSGRGTAFVASLQPTDRIAVTGRAMYSGWTNSVNKVQIDVLYLV